MLDGMLLAHVDDLLFTGSKLLIEIVLKALRTFRTGDLETLATKVPIIFTGMMLWKLDNGDILLSQQHYVQELPTKNIDHCIQGEQIADVADLRSTSRQGMGSLIWAHRTRPDVGFTITQIATGSKAALSSATAAREICRKYNRIIKFMRNHQRKIHYTRFDSSLKGTAAIRELPTWGIIAFTDAGFGSLTNHFSIESNFLVLGRAAKRDGIAHCHGGLLDHRCAKIHRVCRSSLSAEAHAAITAVDWSLWFQVFLIELFTNHFEVRKISPPTSFPLRNPFGKSPTDNEVCGEVKQMRANAANQDSKASHRGKSKTPVIMDNGNVFMAGGTSCSEIQLECARCQTSICVDLKHPIIAASFNYSSESPEIVYDEKLKGNNHRMDLFKSLVVTDCCSLYSCILRFQPNAIERCVEILIGYLRDIQNLIVFSFIDAIVNLADVSTKHAGSMQLLESFFKTGKFMLSFMGRQASKKSREKSSKPTE